LVVRHEIEAVSIEEEGLAVAPHAKRTPERLSMFSDAVFAVLITVLVLELRPPALPTFNALLSLWPTWLSYAVSYLFIAIVWANHHHLLHYANEATPGLMWFNFAHLFSVSLLPLSTAWMAVSGLAPQPVAFYASVFFLVNITYICLIWELLGERRSTRFRPRSAKSCASGPSPRFACSRRQRLWH
jgi:TMEM175 potassium channel family protein